MQERPSKPAGDVSGNEMPGSAGASRFESAHRLLKSDIMSGAYSPNQHLVEAALTGALGVSRATVRLVLTRLHEEGLIDIEPNRGARVRAVSIAEAVEVLQVREVLEGLAASLAATRASTAQIEELGRIVQEMEHAIAGGDLLRYSELNGRFHGAIHTAAAHISVGRTLESLNFPLVRYRFRTVLVPGRKEKSLAEHREIYACIARRDSVAAERAARQHVAQVCAALSLLKETQENLSLRSA
ncbi:MAG: GntR family transcriptional regulator [Proteobacteria bacterium]|nr:GntR family transcriptional regulator [Pseudomonadota bacterium]